MMHDDYDQKYVRLCNVEWFNVEIDPTQITVGQLRRLSSSVDHAGRRAALAGDECIVECNKRDLEDSLAETIVACCNLAAAFGIFDIRDAIDRMIENYTDAGCISKRLTDRQMQVMKFFEEHRDSGFTEPEDGV